jgi:hypothetical protein
MTSCFAKAWWVTRDLSVSLSRWMDCLEHWVHPCMARKESALHVVQPLILTMKRTKPIFSGEVSPLFSTCSIIFFQAAPRKVRREGMIRGGNSSSVSALYIRAVNHFFNNKGCRRGLYPSTCNLSTQILSPARRPLLKPWRRLFQPEQLPLWHN